MLLRNLLPFNCCFGLTTASWRCGIPRTEGGARGSPYVLGGKHSAGFYFYSGAASEPQGIGVYSMENTMAAELIPAVVRENQGLFGALALGGLVMAGLSIRAFRKWIAGGVCTSQAKLDGKTVIITGANSGIGLEAAVDIAKRNARVILACRSVERGEAALADVKKRSGNNNVVFVQLDLGSLDSVRAFAAKILEDEPRIDILINNAGVMMIPKRTLTSDGFEMQFGVNHLGHSPH